MSLTEVLQQANPGPLKEAVEHSRAGRGASALVAAEKKMLDLLGGLDEDEPFTLEAAWAMSQHAEILYRYGDPDLAVAAADLAMRTFLNRGAEINQTTLARVYYVRAFTIAALIAADVHQRFGRADIAASARSMADESLRTSPGITVEPALPLLADMSLARALDRVLALPADRSPQTAEAMASVERIKGSVIVPAVDCTLAFTSGRATELEPVLVAGILAAGCAAVADDDPAAALRIGLEAHVLYAGASEAQTPPLRYDFASHGQLWARTLLLCSRAAAQHDMPDLALDLASWMGGAVEGLVPVALISPETRSLACECLAWHAELLQSHGKTDGANQARQMLRGLKALP